MLLAVAGLDASDILAGVVAAVVNDVRLAAAALCHVNLKALCLYGLVGIGRGIIICELYRRNGIVALIARNSQNVVHHVSLQAISGKLGLVRNLRVVLVPVFRELHLWLLDKFQVASTTNNNS